MQKESEKLDKFTKNFLKAELEEKKHISVMRGKAFIFTLVFYGFIYFITVIIIFLEGFYIGGFKLDPGFLHWLGAASIGQIGALTLLVYKFLFGRSR